jgi:hypothetical protein
VARGDRWVTRAVPAALAILSAVVVSSGAAPAAATSDDRSAPVTIAAVTASPGRILYRPWTGDHDLWVMDADGTDRRRITHHPHLAISSARWSPDGTRIAYARYDRRTHDDWVQSPDAGAPPPIHELWVVAGDGAAARRVPLPASTATYTDLAWVGGDRLLFSQDDAIWVVGIDGSDLRRVEPEVPEGMIDRHSPDWSGSAGRVFFLESHPGGSLVASAALDGTDRRGHHPDEGVADLVYDALRVSPDAGQVLVASTWGCGACGFWAQIDHIDLATGDTTSVHPGSEVGRAAFSPTGTEVVHRGGMGLAVAELDRGTVRWLGVDGHAFDWSWAGGRFVDTLGSPHEPDIDRLAAAGVVKGCAPERYCTRSPVTRGQVASLIDRALGLPPTDDDLFDDDDGTTHEAAINRVAAAGIVLGTGDRTFAPGGTLSRAQMASVLTRAFELPAATGDPPFEDVAADHPHGAAIAAVAAAGITRGCTPSAYCPSSPVLRDQMAAFLARALDRA